jgi:hypothetical protein
VNYVQCVRLKLHNRAMSFQPKSAAPVSRDVVEGVRKKMAAPAGPPPSGMFHAPRTVSSRGAHSQSSHSQDRYDQYDNERGSGRYVDRDHGGRYDDEDEDDDYYSDEDRPVRESRDAFDNERYYRNDGGRDERDDDGRDYTFDPRADSRHDNYSGENQLRRRQDRDRDHDDSPIDDREQDHRPILKPRPTDDTASSGPSSHAQSKQYSAGGLENAPSAKADAPVAQEVRRDMIGPSGPATNVVSAYLVRARSNLLNYQPVLRATYRELKYYVTAPCPPGVTARCYIERNRTGSKMLAPYYSICADLDGKDACGISIYVFRDKLLSVRVSNALTMLLVI